MNTRDLSDSCAEPTVDFQGSRVTSDGGLLLVRDLDERLGLSELISATDGWSAGKDTQLPLPDLLRQSIYSHIGAGLCAG
jgi:hypothetical protein